MRLSESSNTKSTTQINPNTGIPEVCDTKHTGVARWWPLALAFIGGGLGVKAFQKYGKKSK